MIFPAMDIETGPMELTATNTPTTISNMDAPNISFDGAKNLLVEAEAVLNCREQAVSLALSWGASEAYKRAKKTEDCGEYARALSGFREAILLWPKNRQAGLGFLLTRKEYMQLALRRGDFALAQRLEMIDFPINAGAEIQEELRQEVISETRQRQERRKTERKFPLARIEIACAAGLIIVAVMVVLLSLLLRTRFEAEQAKASEEGLKVALEVSEEEREKIERAMREAMQAEGRAQAEKKLAEQRSEDLIALVKEFSISRGERESLVNRLDEVVRIYENQPDKPSIDMSAPSPTPTSTLTPNPMPTSKPAPTSTDSTIDICNALQTAIRKANPRYDGTAYIEVEGERVVWIEFHQQGEELVDLSPLAGLPLRKLGISWAALDNIEPLRGMPLVDLRIGNNKNLSLDPLKRMPLTRLILRIPNMTKLDDVIKGMDLTELYIQGFQTSDLNFLQGMKLTNLALSACTPASSGSWFPEHINISSLEPLRGMPLESLSIPYASIRSLAPLKGMPLKELDLFSSRFDSLTPLRGMNLSSISLTGSFDSLEPLRGMKLKSVYISGSGVKSLAPLRGMPIVSLDIEGCPLSWKEIASIIRKLPLEWLNIHGIKADDLTPIKGMRLHTLIASDNPVKSLVPLKDMPLRAFYFTPHRNLKGLDVIRALGSIQSMGIGPPNRKGLYSRDEFWRRYDAGEFD